jgi:hypothetical protein
LEKLLNLFQEAVFMYKKSGSKITVFILTVFMISLFVSSTGISNTFAGGIDELNQSINKLEISDDNAAGAAENQSEAAAGNGAADNAAQTGAGAGEMNVTAESVASGVESIKNGFKSIFDGFKDIFKGIFDLFKELINNFKKLFSSSEADIKRAGEELGNQVDQGVRGVNEAANEAAEGIKDSADGVAEGLNNAANEAADAVDNAAQGVGVDVINQDNANGAPAGGDTVPPAAEGNTSGNEGANAAPAGGTVIDEDPNGLNVRSGPWGDIIGTLQKGAKVEILGREGEWYKIKHDGKEAFVYAGLVSLGGNSEPSGAAANANANGAPAQQETEGANADEAAQPVSDFSAAFSSKPPYFFQYDNELYAGSSCQNTSIAMVLAKYGWKGNPDHITKSFGKDMAQTPVGLETVFNAVAEKDGLKVRVKSHSAGTMELVNKLLAEGKPVIAHGWFTKSGHVVTITGFDGENYTVNDPAGKWNGQYKGGYSSESGKGVKYSKEAMIEALVENGGVWCHEICNAGV